MVGLGDRDPRTSLLREIAAVAAPMLHPECWAPVGTADGFADAASSVPASWVRLANLLDSPDRLDAAIDDYGHRLQAPTRVVAASLFARSLTTSLAWIALSAWGRLRRGIDLSPAHIGLRVEGVGAVVWAVDRDAAIAVLRADPVASSGLAGLDVCSSDDALREWVLARSLDCAVPAVIAAVRDRVRMGSRHLWGNVAITAANLFTTISHDPALRVRADADRAAVLARGPELQPTIELATEPDGRGGEITFAHRLTCCLLVKVPGAPLCSTCSLRPRSERLALTGDWYRAERAERGPSHDR